MKKEAPEHFKRLRHYTESVKHGSEWVRDQIEANKHAFHETSGLFMSSQLKPAHAVGEFLGNMDHHIDHI